MALGTGGATAFSAATGFAVPNVEQNITVNVEERSPAAIAHAVEMAGLKLGQRLMDEGV